MTSNKKEKWYKHLFNGNVFAVVLSMEILEEILEEAYSSLIAWFIGKAISVLFVVVITQGTKILIKRFVKSLTYKEGNDKMKVLKKLGKSIKNTFRLIWNNKYSVSSIVLSAGVGSTGYFAFLNYIYSNLYMALAFGVIVFIVSLYIVFNVKDGFETLTQINTRLQDKLLTKEQKVQAKRMEKAIEEKAKELAKIQEDALKERAKALIEEENRKTL